MHTLRSQGQSNKFLTTQRSFDTDDEKDIGKLHNPSNVDLADLEHHVVTTLNHRHDDQDARPRTPTGEPSEVLQDASPNSYASTQRLVRPSNPLRHAPDVSGIAITTVTEEKWSDA